MGSWTTADRHYVYDDHIFTKRDLLDHERKRNNQGNLIRTPCSAERLRNDFEALQFIREKTTIPVPKVLEFNDLGGGTYELKMERVYGTPLSSIKENRDQAVTAVDEFIRQSVLPQLRSLRSRTVGALTGDIIPPVRLWEQAEATRWTPWKSLSKKHVFCHNDLAQQNILVDEETWEVVGIIDWEYSGFYCEYFEAPLWSRSTKEQGYYDIDADKIPDLISFLSQGEHRSFWEQSLLNLPCMSWKR